MMSITKFTFCALTAASCVGVSAERLLPDHLRLAADAGADLHASAAHWRATLTPDLASAPYLHEQAAATPGRAALGPTRAGGRWSATAAAAADMPWANPGDLIEALAALGPIGVSMADYLALPSLFAAQASVHNASSSQAPTNAGRARSGPASGQTRASFMPIDNAFAAAQAATAPRERWPLPSALSDPLTRYLFTAAALTIVAGAGLRLAHLAHLARLTRLTRRSSAHRLVRL